MSSRGRCRHYSRVLLLARDVLQENSVRTRNISRGLPLAYMPCYDTLVDVRIPQLSTVSPTTSAIAPRLSYRLSGIRPTYTRCIRTKLHLPPWWDDIEYPKGYPV